MVTVSLDGRTTRIDDAVGRRAILDATLRVRPDAPYSCTGGVCGTCRAHLVSGEVRMDRNYALEPDEVAAGVVLACQAHPVTTAGLASTTTRRPAECWGSVSGPAPRLVTVCSVSAVSSHDAAGDSGSAGDVAALMPMVRRIVLARVGAHPSADDLIQETLVRVLAALPRVEPGMLEPYAIVTARNVVASMWRDDDRRDRATGTASST